MEAVLRKVVSLELDDGTCPFEEWLAGLKDRAYMRAVDARLVRVRNGNFGNHKKLGGGIFELKIPRGPGLRVYYGVKGETLVVLLGGGDKSSQRKDIKAAQELWRKYKSED